MLRRAIWAVAVVVASTVLVAGYTGITRAAAEAKGDASSLLAEASEIFERLPEKMPGGEDDTKVRVELGEKLYNETAISVNRTQSCNSCHRLDEKRGGVDNLPTSEGAEGEFGDRNSPTTLNAGFHIAQFWDGREPDLKAQAKGPVLNPIEMGMPNEELVLSRLREAGYEPAFKAAFPGIAESLTYDNYAEAVAAFERTLVTRDRFDDFLGGQLDALTAAEQAGLKSFVEVGCIDCHNGALLGGDSFEQMGQAHPYANTKDLGRFAITKDEDDKYVFKTPSLRNIALTAPYFHDGKAATLNDAVGQMAWLQLGEKLDAKQTEAIATFLGSLSDKERAAK